MKRSLLALLLAGTMALTLLTGCGGGKTQQEAPAEASTAAVAVSEPQTETESTAAESAAASAGTQEAPAAESAAASAPAESAAAAEPKDVSPYAWQGLENMPQCAYLDAFCSYHYYRKFTSYALSYATETVEAVDGINSYKESSGRRTYSVDGHVIVFNDTAKNYMEQDLGSLAEDAAANIEQYKADGTNLVGRTFVTTGTGVIPGYSEKEGDETEYEYYEYNYPSYEEYDMQMTERFYLKDGDVFAIYQETTSGESTLGTTEVIHSMSGEIPDGTFDIPSTDGYEKLEI